MEEHQEDAEYQERSRFLPQEGGSARGEFLGEGTRGAPSKKAFPASKRQADPPLFGPLLRRLGEADRLLLTLYYFGGSSLEGLAPFLELPVETVRQQVQQAQQRFQEELGRVVEEVLPSLRRTPALPQEDAPPEQPGERGEGPCLPGRAPIREERFPPLPEDWKGGEKEGGPVSDHPGRTG